MFSFDFELKWSDWFGRLAVGLDKQVTGNDGFQILDHVLGLGDLSAVARPHFDSQIGEAACDLGRPVI